MIFSVGVIKKSWSLQCWWVLLLFLQRTVVIGQHISSDIDSRPLYGETISNGYDERYNSKQGIEDYVAEDYDDNSYQHYAQNSKIFPNHYNINNEGYQVNYYNTIKDDVPSEDILDGANSKTSLQLHNPSNEIQHEQNRPKVIVKVIKPLKQGVQARQFHYEPYKPAENTYALFQALGSHRNRDEIVQQVIESGRNNIGSDWKSQLKNAYLTKFTSYNITQLKEGKHNESFLLEKRDNSSSNISYMDSKNISTNYSDTHSSLLKTILEPEIYANDLYLVPSSHTLGKNNKRKELKESSENNRRNEDSIKFTKDLLNETNKNPTNFNLPNNNDINQRKDIFMDWNVPKSEIHQIIPKVINHLTTDFVKGEYISNGREKVDSGSTQAYDHYNGPDGVLGGQLLGQNNTTENKTTDVPGVLNDFVGGQFIDIQDSRDNKSKVKPTPMSEDTSAADFVSGQFIKYYENEQSTHKFSFDNEYEEESPHNNDWLPDDVVGPYDPEYHSAETNEYIQEYSPDDSNHTFITKPTSYIEFDTSDSVTESNTAMNNPKYTTEFVNNYVNNEALKTDKIGIHLYDNESTPYDKHLESSTTQDEQTTITYETKKKDEDVTEIFSDNKQTILVNTEPSMNQEENEGKLTTISGPPHIDTMTNNYNSASNGYPNNYIYPNGITKKIFNVKLTPLSRPRPHYYTVKKIYTSIPSTPKIIVHNGHFTPIPVYYYSKVASKSPDEELQTRFLIPSDISTTESKSNMDDLNEQFSETAKLETATKEPMVTPDNNILGIEYEEYEDDNVLSTKFDGQYSILVTDSNSNQHSTELAKNDLNTNSSTKGPIIKDILSFEGFSTVSPSNKDVTVDNIVAESSNILPIEPISNRVTSSLPNIYEKDTYLKTTVYPQNSSGSTSVTDYVELYAGPPLITLNDTYIPAPGHFAPPLIDFIKDKHKKSHLGELCMPLTKQKYVSLLDLISGPFYFDSNGKKIALALRGDLRENCTLNSKECKLILDLKNMSSPLSTLNSLKFIKEHGKRHISKDSYKPYIHPEQLHSDSYKTFGEQSNVEHLNSDNQMLNSYIKQFLNSPLEAKLKEESYPGDNKDNQKRILEYKSSPDLPLSKFISPNTLGSISNTNFYQLPNYGPDSNYHDKFYFQNEPNKELPDHKPHKNRPVRTIDIGRSNEGEKCGCGENQILKSPSPYPNYKEFVAKRYDILKNIVHTVGSWRGGS